MSWEDNTFPRANDPTDVGWLISYWRIVPCALGCKGDYRLESRQFDHLVKAATKKEALQRFQTYIDNKREAGENPGLKGLTLFLSKVEVIEQISDFTGAMLDG